MMKYNFLEGGDKARIGSEMALQGISYKIAHNSTELPPLNWGNAKKRG